MEQRLKQRLVGACVLVLLAVVFVPMLLDDTRLPDEPAGLPGMPPRPVGDAVEAWVPPLPPEPPGETTLSEDDTGAPGSETAPLPGEGTQTAAGEPVPAAEGQGGTGAAGKSVPAGAPAQPVAPPKPGEVAKPARPAKPGESAAPVPQPKPPGPAKPAEAAAQPKPAKPTGSEASGAWAVQLGSFASADNAQALVARLQKAGFRAFLQEGTTDGRRSYKVRVGPVLLRSEADALLKRLAAEQKLDGMLVRHP